MKKQLLTLAIAFTSLCAMAEISLTPAYQGMLPSTFEAADAVFSAPVATTTDGTLYLAGAHSEDLTVGTETYTAIGQSAFVAQYNQNGMQWLANIEGSASVTAITVGGSNDVYVAGTFADEVVFHSTDGTSKTIAGLEMFGDYTVDQNASFIAHYDAAGKLLQLESYVPELLDALLDYCEEIGFEDYFPLDMYFRINHLSYVNGKVYGSAIYYGQTSVGDAVFEGSFYDLYGFFVGDVKGAGVFSLDSDLSNGAKVASLCADGYIDMMFSDVYEPTGVTFTVADGDVYAAFAGNGPLALTCKEKQVMTKEIGSNYYLVVNCSAAAENLVDIVDAPDGGFSNVYIPSAIVVDNNKYTVVGYQRLEEAVEGSDDTKISFTMFTISNTASAAETTADFVKYTVEDGSINFYGITSVAALDQDGFVVAVKGYYTAANGDFKNGDFSKQARFYNLASGNAVNMNLGNKATGVCGNGKYVACSCLTETSDGYMFQVGTDNNSGIESIAVDNANAPVEYFNLQGIRVANPENGIYIRRQGSATSKVAL